LDLVPVTSATSPGAALHASVELARAAEGLGYHRYWVAEHHNMSGIASSSPAVLIGHLAGATTTLRVGSGGVMLPNHAPLIVAEQFGTLAALHPGRIDLGLGRAPGTDPMTVRALRRDPAAADEFPSDVAELRAYLTGTHPQIKAVPTAQEPPDVWLLGSSGFSAQLAGILGLPFAFAHHFSARNTEPALALYRSSFEPSEVLSEPYAMVTAAAICADTDAEAERLGTPMGLSMLRLRSGRPGPLPTVEEALAHPYTDGERQAIGAITEAHVIGSPGTVRKGLEELIGRTGPDELMISTNVGDPSARTHSYTLTAEILADL
jgi:luciferase family oxidoreductase group 1